MKIPALLFQFTASVVALLAVATTQAKTETDTVDKSDAMQRSYDFIMSSNDPVSEMQKFMHQLKSIYARAELRLQQFDETVNKAQASDEPLNLLALPEYRKVQVMHSVRDLAEDKMEYVYQHLQNEVQTSNLSDPQRLKSDAVLRVVESEFNSIAVSDRLIFKDLKTRLESDSGLAPTQQDQFTQVEFNEAHLHLVAQARAEEAHAHDALARDIKMTEEALKKAEPVPPKEQAKDWMNLSMQIAPGGTITGNEFPVGTWAMTYDDGPHPTYTMQDVANLRANGGKATFFWLAKNTGLYPGVIRGVQAAGFPVEDHSWSHPILNSPSSLAKMHTSLQHEIVDSSNVQARQYGVKPRFFRCPYGAGINSPAIRQLLAQQGMINVFWNVDSLDWQDHNPASIVSRVQKQMARQRRGIILFHDIHPQSVAASSQLMRSVRGTVNWVTIPGIVDGMNGRR